MSRFLLKHRLDGKVRNGRGRRGRVLAGRRDAAGGGRWGGWGREGLPPSRNSVILGLFKLRTKSDISFIYGNTRSFFFRSRSRARRQEKVNHLRCPQREGLSPPSSPTPARTRPLSRGPVLRTCLSLRKGWTWAGIHLPGMSVNFNARPGGAEKQTHPPRTALDSERRRRDWPSHRGACQTGPSNDVTLPLSAEAGAKEQGWLGTNTGSRAEGRRHVNHGVGGQLPSVLTWLRRAGNVRVRASHFFFFSLNKIST